MGIERICNTILTGHAGSLLRIINSTRLTPLPTITQSMQKRL